MKKILFIAICSASTLCVQAQSKKELRAENAKLKEQIAAYKAADSINIEQEYQKFSYALGVNIASNLQNQGIDSLHTEALKQGFEDFYKDDNQVALQESAQIVNEYMAAIAAEKTKAMQAEGQAYLEANAAKPGVKVTDSGLQYEILKEGDGPIPEAKDRVKVHYHGTLINGEVFDSSVDRGSPATFGVTQVIQGWVEALQMMPVGSKWRLTIPYDLAYGERGAGGKIGPYSTLIFEVELLEIINEESSTNK